MSVLRSRGGHDSDLNAENHRYVGILLAPRDRAGAFAPLGSGCGRCAAGVDDDLGVLFGVGECVEGCCDAVEADGAGDERARVDLAVAEHVQSVAELEGVVADDSRVEGVAVTICSITPGTPTHSKTIGRFVLVTPTLPSPRRMMCHGIGAFWRPFIALRPAAADWAMPVW